MQGRDRSAHHVFRSSMSDPVYYTRSSMTDPSHPGPQRGMVTPQVNVAEGEHCLRVLLYLSSCQGCQSCCLVMPCTGFRRLGSLQKPHLHSSCPDGCTGSFAVAQE